VNGDLLAAGVLGRTGAGLFAVDVGPRLWDRLIARVAGHARAGTVPVALAVEHLPGRQRWARTIDGRRVTTTLVWRDGAIVERLGPLVLTFAAAPTDGGAVLRLERAALGGVRLPRRAVPAVACTTHAGPGGLAVRVEVRSRRGRRILAYAGTLT
jgi:Domain of unknown function (DUF4166)